MYKKSMYNVVIKSSEDKVLLYNSNNSALAWVPKELYVKVENGKEIDESEAHTLRRMGFLVDDYVDEFSAICFGKNVFLHNTMPESVGYVIAPTMRCNMKCSYCFENSINNKKTMSIEIADSVVEFIIDQLKNNSNVKKLWIRWFGGEPCLSVDIICYISKKLIAYCDTFGIHYSSMIVSNGYLLNSEVAEKLKKYGRVKRTQITLDGLATTYAKIKGVQEECFQTVIDNISNICDIIDVIVRINVSKENVNETQRLARFLMEDLGLSGKIWIYFERVREFAFNEAEYISVIEHEIIRRKNIFDLIDRGHINSILHYLPKRNLFSCSAMQMMSATIGPDGNLYRCDNGLGNVKYRIGTVRDGFFRNEMDSMFINCDYLEKCKKCNLLPICGGGCLEERLIEKHEMCCDGVLSKLKTDIDVFLIKNEEKRGE